MIWILLLMFFNSLEICLAQGINDWDNMRWAESFSVKNIDLDKQVLSNGIISIQTTSLYLSINYLAELEQDTSIIIISKQTTCGIVKYVFSKKNKIYGILLNLNKKSSLFEDRYDSFYLEPFGTSDINGSSLNNIVIYECR